MLPTSYSSKFNNTPFIQSFHWDVLQRRKAIIVCIVACWSFRAFLSAFTAMENCTSTDACGEALGFAYICTVLVAHTNSLQCFANCKTDLRLTLQHLLICNIIYLYTTKCMLIKHRKILDIPQYIILSLLDITWHTMDQRLVNAIYSFQPIAEVYMNMIIHGNKDWEAKYEYD